MNQNGCKQLAAAIIGQAVDDVKKSRYLKSAKRFLTSDWAERFARIVGIENLKEILEQKKILSGGINENNRTNRT